MSPEFTKKKFSVFYGSPAYNDNFNRAFGRTIFLNWIEEFWAGQKAVHLGRVEVYPEESNSPYAVEEIGFVFKDAEKYYEIRDKWDFKRVNKEELEELRGILKTEMDNILKERNESSARKEKLKRREIENIIRYNFFKEFDETNPKKNFSNGGWLIEEEAQVVGIADRVAQAIMDVYLCKRRDK